MNAVLREAAKEDTASVHLNGVDWCEVTSIGLKINRPNASLEEMQETLDQLMIAHKGSPLALGDIMCKGEKRHGDKWAQAVDVNKKTGIKIKTLLEYRRVSEHVPISIRMESQNVEWSHYQIIAGQPEELRKKWVQLVAEHGWSPPQLRKEISEINRPSVNPEDDKNYLDPHYKQLLLDYIASSYSFLNRCTYEPFKREIERTIKAARFQYNRAPATDREEVKAQVDKMCTTPEEVAEEVPLSEQEIEAFFIQLVGCPPPRNPTDPTEAGSPYEWRTIGVVTEMSKGLRNQGIFRKDAPHWEGSETHNKYAPTVDWE